MNRAIRICWLPVLLAATAAAGETTRFRQSEADDLRRMAELFSDERAGSGALDDEQSWSDDADGAFVEHDGDEEPAWLTDAPEPPEFLEVAEVQAAGVQAAVGDADWVEPPLAPTNWWYAAPPPRWDDRLLEAHGRGMTPRGRPASSRQPSGMVPVPESGLRGELPRDAVWTDEAGGPSGGGVWIAEPGTCPWCGSADGSGCDACDVCGDPAAMAGRGRQFSVGGWLDQGFTWNPQAPVDNFNGPVTFNDRANEYQLNQLYLYMQRSVVADGNQWDLGGRIDLLYGTDYFFTTALGLETHRDGSQHWNSNQGPRGASLYGLAMPQAYFEVAAPLARGLSFQFGHFYTIIGYETVTAPDNFFYSHAYTMQYGEPFTHTGMLAKLQLTPQWLISSGVTRGWDNWDDTNSDLGYLGGVSWTSRDEQTSVAFAIHTGTEQDEPPDTDNRRTMGSLVVSHQLSRRLQYVVQHDQGFEDDVPITVAPGVVQVSDARWYGINQYFLYKLTDTCSLGLRYEWFRDKDGTRVRDDGVGADYFAVTLGLNWRPTDWMVVRPELRIDWVDTPGVFPYDAGTDDDQILFATSVLMRF